MVGITRRSVERTAQLLAGPAGIAENLAAIVEGDGLTAAGMPECSVMTANLAAELIDKNPSLRYPVAQVKCEQLVNSLQEKFRQFSGKARICVELRVTHDRIEEIDRLAHFYAGAVARVLEQNRGDWGNGMFYAGGYEVSFSPAKHGGKNYVQSAAVRFDVELSL